MTMPRSVVLALLGACLLATPLAAQNRGGLGHTGSHGGPPGGTHGMIGGGMVGIGRAPRGPVGWGDFHHDTSPAKVSPHRFGGTNLPVPNAWHGNIHNFDASRWQGGIWRHASHNGRLGWWWIIGPDWYSYDTPVYPYPDLYTPPGSVFGWWYWCDAYEDYYPYVTSCPVPWEPVMPRT